MPISNTQKGASLIEVMVAITVLGFGLLGLAGVQVRTTGLNDSAYYRSVAVDLSNDLADRIRAIRTPYMANADADPQPTKPPNFAKCAISGTTNTCASQDTGRDTHETLVESEMDEWAALLQKQLPGSTYSLSQVAGASSDFFRYTLTITWLDNRRAANSADQESSYSVVIE